jgi:CDP-ribitol ribitolphosphotransferase
MGAFKTVGYSRSGKTGGPDSISLTHRGYTGAIVSSESIRKNYAEAFNMDIEKVDALGIPRTDIFFDKKYETNIKKKLYEKYPKLKNKKVILFAPTFRGNGQKSAYYNFDWIDFKKFGDVSHDDTKPKMIEDHKCHDTCP